MSQTLCECDVAEDTVSLQPQHGRNRLSEYVQRLECIGEFNVISSTHLSHTIIPRKYTLLLA